VLHLFHRLLLPRLGVFPCLLLPCIILRLRKGAPRDDSANASARSLLLLRRQVTFRSLRFFCYAGWWDATVLLVGCDASPRFGWLRYVRTHCWRWTSWLSSASVLGYVSPTWDYCVTVAAYTCYLVPILQKSQFFISHYKRSELFDRYWKTSCVVSIISSFFFSEPSAVIFGYKAPSPNRRKICPFCPRRNLEQEFSMVHCMVNNGSGHTGQKINWWSRQYMKFFRGDQRTYIFF
jgi:hypothetical protein